MAASSARRIPIEIREIALTGIPLLANMKMQVVSSLDAIKSADFLAVLTRSAAAGAAAAKGKKQQLATVPTMYDAATNGALGALLQRQKFNGAEAKTASVFVGGPKFTEAGVVGLGSNQPSALSILDGFDMTSTTGAATSPICPSVASRAGKGLADMLSPSNPTSVCVALHKADLSPCGLQAFLEGLFLALTPDERYKSEKSENPSRLNAVYVQLADGNDADREAYAKATERATHSASGIQMTRELLNAPPNVCNPETLADAAGDLAKTYGLECKILGEEECIERKMGAYLAVHQGSMYAPQFIHMTYKPASGSGSLKRIVLIGKGLCMDTGGYNLKVGCGIETMKMDMGGAAAVFGAARMVGGLKPQNVEVHFIVAAAENMISSRAYRPGDIVTASNGKTIEVGNTDAEGRLTLADALVYAETEVKPDFILDCATLTGASMVGLGNDIGAIYGTTEEWTQRFLKSARATGTAIWPLPLFRPYRKLIDSKLADLSNVSSTRYGGSITAALFLKEFVKDTPWCHVDMAGPVYDYSTKEGTGYGAKFLAHAVMSASASQ